MRHLMIVLAVLVLVSSAYGLDHRAFQMREDYGTEPLYDCWMNYYYYIPCPTGSWFWAFSGWYPGQTIGQWFLIGDPSMAWSGSGCPPYVGCEPCGLESKSIERIRVLDLAGLGTIYPGLYTVKFDLYCADADGLPVGPAIWSSGPVELGTAGWNYLYPMWGDVLGCATQGWCYPRLLITATHVGTDATYPAWGFDNISAPVGLGCPMHDTGCCPALYPRPQTSHYTAMHSGDYGANFEIWPPNWFPDPADTSGGTYGYVELAWRIYTSFHMGTEPSTWGTIKSMYK